MSSDQNLRSSVLLSVQRALLDAVTSNMRLVNVRWDKSNIRIRIVFAGRPSESDVLRVSEIETEVIADFPSEMTIVATAEESDPTQKVRGLEGERTVFARAEDDLFRPI